MAAAARAPHDYPHIPVLIDAILAACAPIEGTWIDGTFGAGGYTRRLLEAGADRIIAIDRDPAVFEMAKPWAGAYAGRLDLVQRRPDLVPELLGGMELFQPTPDGIGAVDSVHVGPCVIHKADRAVHV